MVNMSKAWMDGWMDGMMVRVLSFLWKEFKVRDLRNASTAARARPTDFIFHHFFTGSTKASKVLVYVPGTTFFTRRRSNTATKDDRIPTRPIPDPDHNPNPTLYVCTRKITCGDARLSNSAQVW